MRDVQVETAVDIVSMQIEMSNNISIGGGDNWAKKHEKWHRTTVCEQLLPEIEKAQSVTPQTTKYRYRAVIFNRWIH